MTKSLEWDPWGLFQSKSWGGKKEYIVMYMVETWWSKDPEILLRIGFLVGEIKRVEEEAGKENFIEPTWFPLGLSWPNWFVRRIFFSIKRSGLDKTCHHFCLCHEHRVSRFDHWYVWNTLDIIFFWPGEGGRSICGGLWNGRRPHSVREPVSTPRRPASLYKRGINL